MTSLKTTFFNALKLSLRVEYDKDEWSYDEEPHVARRREILAKYPQIKQLMGHDPFITWIVLAEVAIQLAVCCFVGVCKPDWKWTLLIAYVIGATINHSLGTAIHEIGHNLAFGLKRPWANRILSMVCNLPLSVPMAITYKKYHTDHHRWLGHDSNDVDIPTRVEAKLFRNSATKLLWLVCHPVIHALRPFLKSPKPMTHWEWLNFVVCVAFDYAVVQLLGWQALAYLAVSTFFGFGLHPTSGHFISEHYLFTGGLTTHSYYGCMNAILFNVGYHNEHHDFPYVPYRRLPEIRRIASEYYDCFPHHTSWVKVLWHFVTKSELGPHARGVNLRNASRPQLHASVQKETELLLNKWIIKQN